MYGGLRSSGYEGDGRVAIEPLLVFLAVTALLALTAGAAPTLHSSFTQGSSV